MEEEEEGEEEEEEEEEEHFSVRPAGKLQLEGCVIISRLLKQKTKTNQNMYFMYYVLCRHGDISTASASGAVAVFLLSLWQSDIFSLLLLLLLFILFFSLFLYFVVVYSWPSE